MTRLKSRRPMSGLAVTSHVTSRAITMRKTPSVKSTAARGAQRKPREVAPPSAPITKPKRRARRGT